MTAPELTLKSVTKSAKEADVTVRVSDFLSNEQKIQMKLAREERALSKNRKFDDVDAISAEILARFGWDAWNSWQNGQIPISKMNRMLLAERARQKREIYGLESIILASIAGANNPTKGGHAPKSLKNAIKILKNEHKQAKGVI